MKNNVYCGKCGYQIPLDKKYIIPHYKETGGIVVGNPILCCYTVRCPRCKKKTDYSKDYMREVYKEHNPSKLIIPKL